MATSRVVIGTGAGQAAGRLNWLGRQLARHWAIGASCLLVAYVGLPLLAPALMEVRWTGPARVIYAIYSTQCHQLPQRSFFLFGQQAMYPLPVIQAAWRHTTDPTVLRQFIGSPQMGWKVAWSDRMVAMYGSMALFSLAWAVRRPRIRPLPWWGALLLMAPLAVDGTTHLISDVLSGFGADGFRDTNAWLAYLTRSTLPASFYAGDALGSFNSWMRLISGVLLGLGVVWFVFPYLQRLLDDSGRRAE